MPNIYRLQDGAILGDKVGTDYKIVQNADACTIQAPNKHTRKETSKLYHPSKTSNNDGEILEQKKTVVKFRHQGPRRGNAAGI